MAAVRTFLRRATALALRVSPMGWILVGAVVALGFYVSAFERRAYESCAVRAEQSECRTPFSMR